MVLELRLICILKYGSGKPIELVSCKHVLENNYHNPNARKKQPMKSRLSAPVINSQAFFGRK